VYNINFNLFIFEWHVYNLSFSYLTTYKILILQILLLGLFRQPKWGHLKELHAAIKSCSTTLLQGVQRNFALGELQEVNALNFFSPIGLFSHTAIQIFVGFFSFILIGLCV
jgi:hypothetical protein